MKTTFFCDMKTFMCSADLPSGVYLLHLHMEGQPSEIKKLTLIR